MTSCIPVMTEANVDDEKKGAKNDAESGKTADYNVDDNVDGNALFDAV